MELIASSIRLLRLLGTAISLVVAPLRQVPYADNASHESQLIAFDTTQITSPANRSQSKNGDACHPLASGAHAPAVIGAFKPNQGAKSRSIGYSETLSPTLEAEGGNNKPCVQQGMSARRLTPRECERLQGFPDDWTRWGAEGREISDSARYRMLGNAVTVTVAEWLGCQILKRGA